MMVLYHGSENIIENPQYGQGKSSNDYGTGFYCTESLELAKEWACQKNVDSFANEYLIDETQLKILNLTDSKFSILNWLAILLENRKFNLTPVPESARQFVLKNYLVEYKIYDAIIGWRANDSYFTFAANFLNNIISFSQLEAAMKLGDLGLQFVLKSRKAFDILQFRNFHKADKNIYYKKFDECDENARSAYKEFRNHPDINGRYMIDIIRGL